MFICTSKTWSAEEYDQICSKPWKIADNDGDENDDWYRDELTNLVIHDHWTYDTLVPSIEQDIKDGLTVVDISDLDKGGLFCSFQD